MNRVLLTIITATSCAAFFSCGQKPKSTAVAPVPVNLDTVESRQVYYYDKYPANIQALNQVNILSNVQGYVTSIGMPDGSHVRKGQVLYEIDKRLFEAAYRQALANLKVAQGTQVQSQQDYDRYVYLNKYNAVAKQLYDHAVITLQNSESQTKAAEDAVKTAKTNLDYATIYAPFDGTIGFSQVRLGNVVVTGQTVLNTISTNDPMAVDFIVNEKQLGTFEHIDGHSNSMPDSLFTIQLPDGSLYPYPGKISVIDRAVDPQTGSIRIRLVFPNPKNDLKAGMSCVVRVHNQDTSPQIVVPGKAVVEQMGEYFVYVAKDTVIAPQSADASKAKTAQTGSKPELRAVQKKVKLGQTIGANVVITSGISNGDLIVVDGIQSLHDGSAVTTQSPKPQGKK